MGIHPEPGRHKFRRKTVCIQQSLYLAGFRLDLFFIEIVDAGNGVIIMKLNGGKPPVGRISLFFLQEKFRPW
jgi:hypothetical protein